MARGVHGPHALHERRRDHLRARAVLGLGAQQEACVVGEQGVLLVVVVVHPGGQARAQLVDERFRGLFEARATRTSGGKGHVEHHHTPLELFGLGQLSRRAVSENRENHPARVSARQGLRK
jgi:hypothetical protein